MFFTLGIEMNLVTEIESRWLISLNENDKAVFLARLMHSLTIVGRVSYRIQSDDLDNPQQLRKINEMQHRVAACLVEVLLGKSSESFQQSIAEMLLYEQESELQRLISSAWKDAKSR